MWWVNKKVCRWIPSAKENSLGTLLMTLTVYATDSIRHNKTHWVQNVWSFEQCIFEMIYMQAI